MEASQDARLSAATALPIATVVLEYLSITNVHPFLVMQLNPFGTGFNYYIEFSM